MIIFNKGNNFNYELEKLTRLFLPFERIDVVDTEIHNFDKYAVTTTDFEENGCFVSAFADINGNKYKKEVFIPKTETNYEKSCELSLANCLFECYVHLFDFKPSWGILTGVRPARLYLKTINEIGQTAADGYFTDTLRVDDGKLSLLKQTALSEEKIISLSRPDSFSLYVSVPFCPSRCSYCSFVSHSVEKAAEIIPVYLEYLLKEIYITADIVKNLGLKLETVYIGGGTPTTLSAEQLDMIISKIQSKFDFSSLREFTVEAGRPDTITKQKLEVLKNNCVSRISINPQTLNNDVLNNIGRRHTAEDFYTAFNLARQIGFDNINTDLIAGLPSDTYESFVDTVNDIVTLSPENVTIHSLSMKRSSLLTKNGFEPLLTDGKIASLMVDYGRKTLNDNNIFPYYMYRQSKTVGNLENVGYSKIGYEGLYNVFIMDETHTILACGASGATKLKNPFDGQIKRIFNFKYPYEYINRFEEQMERKNFIYDFYKNIF